MRTVDIRDCNMAKVIRRTARSAAVLRQLRPSVRLTSPNVRTVYSPLDETTHSLTGQMVQKLRGL